MGRHLRAYLSDRVIPRICTATPIGKYGLELQRLGRGTRGLATRDFMWIRSPYTPGYFKQFAPLANELDNIRVNAEGTIDIQYMAKNRWTRPCFWVPGRRGPRRFAVPPRESKSAVLSMVNGDDHRGTFDCGHRFDDLVAGSLDPCGAGHGTPMTRNFEYIRGDERITDVVAVSPTDALDEFQGIRRIVPQSPGDSPCQCPTSAQPSF